jgi:L-amino acid N-acyltransferase YncA
MKVLIRRAKPTDEDALWTIFQHVVAEGDAFLSDESVTRQGALEMWFGQGVHCYVAFTGNETVVGAYWLMPNHHGRGNHIANAAYMVEKESRGKGIGSLLGEHSLNAARELGYKAMQFNCVVSTNESSLALWKKLGFKVVGVVPQGFRHPALGLVDILVMHRLLTSSSSDRDGQMKLTLRQEP